MAETHNRKDRLEARFAARMAERGDRTSSKKAIALLTTGMHHCKYLGGAGFPFELRGSYYFSIAEELLRWQDAEGDALFLVPFSDVLDASTEGLGTVTSGGGFMGGGMGLQGAAVGIAAAGVLNALSQRTHIDSVMRVTTRTAEGLFAFTHAGPQQIFLELAQVRVFNRLGTEPTDVSRPVQPAGGVIEGLERLGALLDRGLITDAEFQVQKQVLMRQVEG